jgi:hypothetical protein
MGQSPRIEDRTRATLRATLRDGGTEREALFADISSRGLMALASSPPARGTYVELRIGRHVLVGRVQWAEGARFGVRLQDRIDVLAVIGNEASPARLEAARKARGRPSAEATFAFARHAGRGFVFGAGLAGAVGAAAIGAQMVAASLAPLAKVEAVFKPR